VELIDGTEEKWQLEWNFVGCSSAEAQSENGVGQSTTLAPTAPPSATSSATTPARAVFVDGNMSVRVREGGVNDRKAWSDAKEHGSVKDEHGVSEVIDTLDETLAKAERIAEWYNARLEARLVGAAGRLPSMVVAAQDAGATLVSVEPEQPAVTKMLGDAPEVSGILNRKDLGKWVTENEWTKEQVQGVLDKYGFKTSAGYLKEDGNTAQGLAHLLLVELNDSELPW